MKKASDIGKIIIGKDGKEGGIEREPGRIGEGERGRDLEKERWIGRHP